MIDKVWEGCLISLVKVEKVLAAAEKGIGRKEKTERSKGWWSIRGGNTY